MDKDQVNATNDDFFHQTDLYHYHRHPPRRSSHEKNNSRSGSNSDSRPILEPAVALEGREQHLPTVPPQVTNSLREMSPVETVGAAEGLVPTNTTIAVLSTDNNDNPEKPNATEMDPTMARASAPIMKTTAAIAVEATKIEAIATKKKDTVPINKKKKPRAKPGFGLRTSRTTIVDTGQKRRSCVCTNSKKCNELMTKWAKISPPDYHCELRLFSIVV